MTEKPWRWEVEGGSKRLCGGNRVVLEARVSRYKPPTLYVRPTDERAIAAVPEMIERLRYAEIALRVNGIVVSANVIKELLHGIGQ